MSSVPWRWLGVSAVVLMVAAPMSAGAMRLLGLERSTWVRITLADGSPTAPALSVRYGPEASLPVQWDSEASSTLIGIEPSSPVRLLAIDTDRGLVPPWLAQTWASDWERSDAPPSLRVSGPGVVDAAGTFRRVTLTFAPAAATVAVGWQDARQTLDLSSSESGAPLSITLSQPTERRGWVLLPPARIDRLALVLVRGPKLAPVQVSEVAVRDARHQVWSAATLRRGHPAPGACTTTVANGVIQIDDVEPACEVALDGVGPFNRSSRTVRVLVWLSIAAGGLMALGVIAAVTPRLLRRFTEGARASTERRAQARRWSPRGVAVVVLVCTGVYHVSYVIAVPPHFNFDSLGYYAYGRNLWFSGSLDAVATCRTPGYPALIALSTGLFGDRLLPILAVQHLALCGLGVMTVWALHARIGPVWSGTAGLLAGVSPIVSLTASTIWTESLFAVFATAALLAFVKAGERGRLLALAGVLAGIATLIRPNGVVLPALMGLWLFLIWWCGPSDRARLWRFGRSAIAMAAGFVLVTAFWFEHVHRITGQWALSDTSCAAAGQPRAALPSGTQATNIFQLAGFTNVISQNEHVQQLAVTEPYRAFFEFFPARHRYYVSRFLPPGLTYDDRFIGEVLREYLRVFPGLYLRQVVDALMFNLTHVQRAHSTIFIYPDLVDTMQSMRARVGRVPRDDSRLGTIRAARNVSWTDAEVLLTRMATARPSLGGLARLHLAGSGAAMAIWGVTAALGLLGGVWCLFGNRSRRVTILAWHAVVLAGAPAVLAMAADRYAMVAEPAFYILVATLAAAVVQSREGRWS